MYAIHKLLVFGCLILTGASATSRGISKATKTCNSLQIALGDTIVQTSGGPEYSDTISNAWNLFNTLQRPACIVYPRNSTHVQFTMKAIYRNKVHYAVRAGSHSGMIGWNNVEGGILFMFSRMKNATYNVAKDTITLQPGVHWGEAVAAVQSYGVAPIGGRITDVGTGLLLGGGLSYIAPEYGFSADSFKELDVVLVTGELVTATATNKYADLFRALKGGVNRFGIVTRFELYPAHTGTKNDKRWFGGNIVYPDSAAEALLNATAKYVRDVKDPKAVLLVSLTFSTSGGEVVGSHLVTIFYHGSSLPQEIYGDFLSIPSSSQSLGPTSYADAVASIELGDIRGFGETFAGSSINGDNTRYLEAYTHFKNYTSTFKDDLQASGLYFTPVLQSQIDVGRARGGNAIDPPDGSYAIVPWLSQFKPEITQVSAAHQKGRQLLIQQIPPSRGLPLYASEIDVTQNFFATYGSYEFLKRTYAKYDPTRFNMQYTQGPIGL